MVSFAGTINEYELVLRAFSSTKRCPLAVHTINDLKFCFDCIVICLPFVKTLKGLVVAEVAVSDLGDCFSCPCIKQVVQKSTETRIAFRIKGFIIELELELNNSTDSNRN
jgi:hypothetical protein